MIQLRSMAGDLELLHEGRLVRREALPPQRRGEVLDLAVARGDLVLQGLHLGAAAVV